MLLTLSAKSLVSGRKAADLVGEDMALIPGLAYGELGLGGLTLHTTLLAGWTEPRLDRFRDRADKAGAPVLLLVEDQPQHLGSADPAKSAAAEQRIDRILRVAHRLGCSSVALSIADPGGAAHTDTLAARLKSVVGRAERLELNLLVSPTKGLTETPELLTALIRRVGGFRIGAYPDFQAAAESGDFAAYLRGLAPYSSVICASATGFDAKGKHPAYDLAAYVEAIKGVGYDATLTLEYRGKGDPMAALAAAKASISGFLTDEPQQEDDSE